MKISSDSSFLEFCIYLLIWFFSIIYAVYCFSVSANEHFRNYSDIYSDFQSGWSFLDRKKDNSDFEWRTCTFVWQKQIFWAIAFLMVQELLKKYNHIKFQHYFQIFTTCAFTLYELGLLVFGFITVQPFIFFLVLSRKRKYLIWITSISLLLTITLLKIFITEENLKNLRLTYTLTSVVIIGFSWANLNCVSFCIDSIEKQEKPNLTHLLSYVLHLPNLYAGPFILYADFKHCYEPSQKSFKDRLVALIVSLLRYTFWYFFTEFMLHFVYVNVISFYPQWIEEFNSWALYGYGYAMGGFFHLKYVFSYGLAIALMKFENIETPATPICIAHVHLYSNMWKYFDVGLYKFLLKYIYIDLGKIIRRKSIVRLFCFMHVFLWHGLMASVLLWSILNYVAVTIEQIGDRVYCSYLEGSAFRRLFTDRGWRALKCLVGAPLLAIAIISNFYFFAGIEIGNLFIQRLFTDDIKSTLLLLSILYCCGQASIELVPKHSNKQEKSKLF